MDFLLLVLEEALSFLEVELEYIMLCLKFPDSLKEMLLKISPLLKWTGDKIELVELIYGLHETKSINNGETDIKTLAEFFELIFQIDLGHYYGAARDIWRRTKEERAKFLILMQKNLNNFLIEKDKC